MCDFNNEDAEMNKQNRKNQDLSNKNKEISFAYKRHAIVPTLLICKVGTDIDGVVPVVIQIHCHDVIIFILAGGAANEQ